MKFKFELMFDIFSFFCRECREVRELVLFDSVLSAELDIGRSPHAVAPLTWRILLVWMMQHCDFHLFHDPRVLTCLTCLAALIAIYIPKKRAIVRVDKFPGVNKVIEFVNM